MKNIFTTIFSMVIHTFFLSGMALSQVSFIDHRGKKIELNSPPEKLVAIVRSTLLIYHAVDGTSKHIAGMNHDSLERYFTSGLYKEIMPEMSRINASAARDGFKPNVEAILQMNPDLIVQWIYDPKIIEPLERVGLKVVGWDCCTQEHRRDYLTLSGYMSGKIDRAQKILSLQDESNKTLRKKFGGKVFDASVNILTIDRISDQIRVVANGSLDLALSGVHNLAADNSGEWWKTIDAEQLFSWNPQMIIIPAYATDLTPEQFYTNPLLANLDSVKNRRVYKVPFFGRTPDAPEIYLTSVWIAAIAHGNENTRSFRDNIQKSYKTIYGADLTEKQINQVLEMKQNSGSRDYSELFGQVS